MLVAGISILLPAIDAEARWGQGQGPGNRQNCRNAGTSQVAANLPYQELSASEKAGLILMREEEKLARDVYTTLYRQWNLPIFNNISQSEQRHMDSVGILLNKYKVDDPVADATVGVFSSATMQQLYTDLTGQGSQSLVAALQVGATIEDLDIKDLNELLAKTDNIDIQNVYANLAKGSRNHLRSFTGQLERNGVVYEAQYLAAEELQAIIDSPKERGRIAVR